MTTETRDIPRRPRVIASRAPTDLSVDSWTIAQTRSALRMHLDGDFSRSALLADALRGDERISADLRTRVMAVTGLPFRIDPSPAGDQRRAKAIAAELAAGWQRICPSSVARSLLRGAAFMSVAYGPIRWAAEGGRWWPTVEPWHLQHLTLDRSRNTWRTQTTMGLEDVVPGDGSWLAYQPEGERAWIDCAVRGLAIPYHLRTFARRDWGRFNEKHGLPITGAVVPEEADQDDKDDFFRDLRNLGSEGIVLLPRDREDRGFKLEMIEPKNVASWKSFEATLYHCDVSIAVALLGQAATAQEGGSFAKAVALAAYRQDLVEADAASLAQALRTQVLRPWAAFNFGDADLAPVVVWDPTPPEDAAKLATTLQTAGVALAPWQAAAAAAGFDVDFESLAQRFGVPIRRRVEPAPTTDPAPQD